MLIKFIKSFYFDFVLSNCPYGIIHLLLSTNALLFDVLKISIQHFVLFFSILSQKEKFYNERKNNTHSSCMIFLRILTFSVLKKNCKNEYIGPFDKCLSDIITSSKISLIMFSIEDFFVS